MLAGQPLFAQVVNGELVDRITQQPVTSGFVVLIDSIGNELARGRIDRTGSFRLVAPGAGAYRLKTQIIGIKSTESSPFDLSIGQALQYRFEITAALVFLPAIIVEDVRTCKAPGDAGLAASTLWEEARKALGAVAWTEGKALFLHKLVLYERERHPRTLVVQDERQWSRTGLYGGSPFNATSAGDLAEDGYIQEAEDGGFYFYGPDATVLLSNEFTDLHCFWPRAGLDDESMVGLSFEPILGRTASDIQGTLWIDKYTAELRSLEFNYTQLPWDVERGRVGGKIEFEHLPDGPWIVRQWWIRMPEVGIRAAKPVGDPDYWAQHEILAIREEGGWVDEIFTRNGAPVLRMTGATVVGKLTETETGDPIKGVRIVFLGTAFETITDDGGRFRIDGVPEAKYFLSLDDAFLDSLGYVPPPVELSTSEAKSVEVDLSVATSHGAWPSVCYEVDKAVAGIGAVTGLVREARSGRPLPGVSIRVAGSRPAERANRETQRDSVLVEATTDAAGYYSMCGVPAGVTLTAQATLRVGASVETTVVVQEGAVIRLDFTSN
jgi:hypothetical protein